MDSFRAANPYFGSTSSKVQRVNDRSPRKLSPCSSFEWPSSLHQLVNTKNVFCLNGEWFYFVVKICTIFVHINSMKEFRIFGNFASISF